MASRDVWKALLSALGLAFGVLLLWKLRTIVQWTLVALFLALVLDPAVEWLVRHRFKRGWAVLVVALVLFVAVGTMVATLVPMLIHQGHELVERAPSLVERLSESSAVQWADERFGIIERLRTSFEGGAGKIATPALGAAKGLLHGLAGAITIITLTLFMLFFGGDLLGASFEWLPPQRRAEWKNVLQRLRKVVGGYVAGTVVVAAIGGVAMAVTLIVLRVPYFVPLGLLFAVLGIIPFLGAALGAVLLIGVTFASAGGKAALICAVVFFVYQQLENHVLRPLVQRKTLDMNPLVITLVLLAGTSLAGVVGTLLALPVAGAIQVLMHDALARRRAKFAVEQQRLLPPPAASSS